VGDFGVYIICITISAKETNMSVITVRLDEQMVERLNRLAKKNRRTKSSYIKEMLELYLEDFEDGYTALERLNQRNARYLNSEEVEAELGL
jgi:RHH-type rel operon transcriptional repressor/antitoxin RelB